MRTALFTIVVALATLTAIFPTAPAQSVGNDYVTSGIQILPLTVSGGATELSLADETVTAAFPLGFTTRFFGQQTNLFWVGSNGFVTLFFQTPPGCCDGQPLPTPGGPDGIIAGLWTDLAPDLTSRVRFENVLVGQPGLLVDYQNMQVLDGNGGRASFQILILENGTLEVFVSSAQVAPTRTVSQGIENIDGTRGMTTLRSQGANILSQGVRFTPNAASTPAPSVFFTSPSSAMSGTQAAVLGSDFQPGASVILQNPSGSDFFTSTFFSSSSRLDFSVPFLQPGGYRVVVQNPDGQRSSAFVIFSIIEPLRLDSVSPRIARQGDTFVAIGGGFDFGTRLLLEGSPVGTSFAGSNFLFAQVPPTLTPGVYDVSVFDEQEGIRTLQDALLVVGAPDLVIERLTFEPNRIGVAHAAAVDGPGWTVSFTIRNAGDAQSDSYTVAVTGRPVQGIFGADPSPETWVIVGNDPLAPGEAFDATFQVGSLWDAGDWEARAMLEPDGFDRDFRGHEKTARAYAYLGGLGGTRLGVPPVAPPPVCPDGCTPPDVGSAPPVYDEREHIVDHVDQVDRHNGATLRVDFRMTSSDITFFGFESVFGSFSSNATSSSSCTTWRFTGTGGFGAALDGDNAMDGSLFIPNASSRGSSGQAIRERWTDTRVAGVIVQESERTSETLPSSTPLVTYENDGDGLLSVFGNNPVGDFSECFVTPVGGSTHVEITFAALPDNTQVLVPNFEGLGSAASVDVSFRDDIETVTTLRSIP